MCIVQASLVMTSYDYLNMFKVQVIEQMRASLYNCSKICRIDDALDDTVVTIFNVFVAFVI